MREKERDRLPPSPRKTNLGDMVAIVLSGTFVSLVPLCSDHRRQGVEPQSKLGGSDLLPGTEICAVVLFLLPDTRLPLDSLDSRNCLVTLQLVSSMHRQVQVSHCCLQPKSPIEERNSAPNLVGLRPM